MNIDTSTIKNKRNEMAWSQQQLADVTGLSLRTVQRIESTGSGSHESVKAIAAAFKLIPSDILEKETEIQSWTLKLKQQAAAIALALSSILASAALFMHLSTPELVSLDLSFRQGPKHENLVYLEDKLGVKMDVKYDEHLTLVFTVEKVKQDKLRITIQAYTTDEVKRTLDGTKILIVEQGKTLTSEMITNQGKRYTFQMTSSIKTRP